MQGYLSNPEDNHRYSKHSYSFSEVNNQTTLCMEYTI
jgi:hypothetical protein